MAAVPEIGPGSGTTTAARGEAPKVALRMSARHVPYGGILFTCTVYFLGVLLNLVVPHRAFDIATALASRSAPPVTRRCRCRAIGAMIAPRS